MSDWEDKFNSIVKETDVNVEKVRDRLEAIRCKSLPICEDTESVPGCPTNSTNRLPLGSGHHFYVDRSLANIRAGMGERIDYHEAKTDRVEILEKMVFDATSSIRELKKNEIEYQKEIRFLQDTVAALGQRPSDISNYSYRPSARSSQYPLSSALSDVDETTSMKKELEVLKAKIITLEHTMAVVNAETTSVSQKQTATQENLCDLTVSSRTNYKELAVQLLSQQQTISQLESTVASLKKKLDELPSDNARKPLSPSANSPDTDDSRSSFSADARSEPTLACHSSLSDGYVPKITSFRSGSAIDLGSPVDLSLSDSDIDDSKALLLSDSDSSLDVDAL